MKIFRRKLATVSKQGHSQLDQLDFELAQRLVYNAEGRAQSFRCRMWSLTKETALTQSKMGPRCRLLMCLS